MLKSVTTEPPDVEGFFVVSTVVASVVASVVVSSVVSLVVSSVVSFVVSSVVASVVSSVVCSVVSVVVSTTSSVVVSSGSSDSSEVAVVIFSVSVSFSFLVSERDTMLEPPNRL